MAYPVGISLGETYLTSAYYEQNGTLVPAIRILASDEWRLFYRETWEDPNSLGSFEGPELQTMLKETLQRVWKATETALNRTIVINSIVTPEHFRHKSSMTVLQEVAIQEGVIERYHQAMPGLNGARLAYNLDSCQGFEMEPGEECDLEFGPNYIMIVDYGENRLSFSIIDVGLYICTPYYIVHYKRYGESNGSIVGSLFYALLPAQRVPQADEAFLQLDEVRYQELSKDLKTYFETFAQNARSRWGDENALKSLRAIVLSGDASNSSMIELRCAFTAFIPEYQHKFRMTLDPSFVYAFGAAQRARHIIQNPDFMAPGPDPYTLDGQIDHAEL